MFYIINIWSTLLIRLTGYHLTSQNKARSSISRHPHSHKYSKSLIYVLHNLQEQPDGFHFFILDLKIYNDFEFFMSSGTNSHVLGPLYLMVSKPLFTFLAFVKTHSLFPRIAGVNNFLSSQRA